MQRINYKIILIFAGFGLLILFGGFIYSKVTLSTLESKIANQNSTISSMQSEYALAVTKKQDEENANVKATTGLDMSRVAKDDEVAGNFFKSVLTWNDETDGNGKVTKTAGQVYDDMRADFIKTYGENNSFATTFLPENRHVAGQNYIDAFHVNSSYEDMESYVKNISSDGTYSYLAFVNWSTHDDTGNEAISECVFSYQVDTDGNFLNPEAWVLTY